jgi:hypothetical protein
MANRCRSPLPRYFRWRCGNPPHWRVRSGWSLLSGVRRLAGESCGAPRADGRSVLLQANALVFGEGHGSLIAVSTKEVR